MLDNFGKINSDDEYSSNFTIIKGDIPENLYKKIIEHDEFAIDIETNGLDPKIHDIAQIQIYIKEFPVVILREFSDKPRNFLELLSNQSITKIFHHATFDVKFIFNKWDASVNNIVCTKISSKLINKEWENHSLKKLLSYYLNVKISKNKQKSDWFKDNLDIDQINYAIEDVIYLVRLKNKLLNLLKNHNLEKLAINCYNHIMTRSKLDILGYKDIYTY